MPELLRIHFVSSNVRTCFFYSSDPDLYSVKSADVCAVEIKFGDNFDAIVYGSISFQKLPEVPKNCLGVTYLFASRLGLKENDPVLVSHFSPLSLETLEVLPRKEEDYIILLSFKNIVETHILNQVRIVAEGQILPLYVFSNIIVDIEIGACKVKGKCGKLENFTEVIVLHPAEKPSKSNIQAIAGLNDEFNEFQKNWNIFRNNFNQTFAVNKSWEKVNASHNHLFNYIDENQELVIWPNSLLPKDFATDDIIVIDIECLEKGLKSLNPYCRLFCKIHGFAKGKNHKCKAIDLNSPSQSELKNERNENILDCTYSHVVFFCNTNKKAKFAFCPSNLMKILNLYVGSRIVFEEVKRDENNLPSFVEKTSPIVTRELKPVFWNDMEMIKISTIENVINNVQFNHNINSLIIGSRGTGKTFLLNELANHFAQDRIFSVSVQCKSIRGKKLDVIRNLLTDKLVECCSREPSVLILDDLHALIYIDTSENPYKKLYSESVSDLIRECIADYQCRYNISVIATATDLKNLSTLVSSHGSRLFQSVQKLSKLSVNDRCIALNNIINEKIQVVNLDFLNVLELAKSTEGYTIQNLNDLVEKALLKCLIRSGRKSLSHADFIEVLEESTPPVLKGIKSKENSGAKWEDVGGMTRPKNILLEIFSWPSKYPEVLASCPLRLQRGVLLYGFPGTGKTLLAGALAKKCGLNFISVKGPEVLSKYVGASEEGVRNLFVQAETSQPCLLFFDEFDSLAPKRGHDSTGVTDRVVNQLLTQLDGVEVFSGVWVLAATSRPDLIDPALLRPGRLDKLVFCDVPCEDDRMSILTALSKNLSKCDDVDLEEMARKSEGLTGADLQALLYNAHMLSIKELKDNLLNGVDVKVKQKHLLEALQEIKPSLTELEKAKYERVCWKRLPKAPNGRRNRRAKEYLAALEPRKPVTVI